VASIRTTARRDGGDYIIDGGKMWTTSGTQADWMCLLANTSEGAPHKNKTLIVLPMKTKGVSIAKKIRKIGMNSSDTGLIHFDDVRVPARFRIGEEGMGFTYQMMQFQEERLWAASKALHGLQRCIDETVAYTRERKLFGSTVLDQQWVHFKLAECQTEVESLRALTHRAVAKYMKGEDATLLASMAKLKCGRLSREVADTCLQFWGGMGFTWDNPVSRMYRDGRLASIGGGADEVMLGIICKYMGTLPRKAGK
jgi:citronellyl-CoA dehydrogenase